MTTTPKFRWATVFYDSGFYPRNIVRVLYQGDEFGDARQALDDWNEPAGCVELLEIVDGNQIRNVSSRVRAGIAR